MSLDIESQKAELAKLRTLSFSVKNLIAEMQEFVEKVESMRELEKELDVS